MTDVCCQSNKNVMILACSGASNVGQLSNQAAIELTQEGYGKMFCLAGIGGQLSGFVQSAKDVPNLVAIDGCQVGCAKAILDQAGISAKNYLILTDNPGIDKNKDFELKREEVEQVKSAIKKLPLAKGAPAGDGGDCSCS